MLSKMWHSLLDIIYPPFCSYCLIYLAEQKPLCGPCMALIQPIASVTVPLAGRDTLTVHAAGVYDDPLRQLIKAKFYRQTNAARQLGHIVWELVLKPKIEHEYSRAADTLVHEYALVPIPLHWTRAAWRGYNQAELIAQELSRLSGLPMINALTRVRATKYQSRLAGSSRSANLHDAFVINERGRVKKDTKLILVDDLMTTGATLIEASKVLKQLKPVSVEAIVVCRALKI